MLLFSLDIKLLTSTLIDTVASLKQIQCTILDTLETISGFEGGRKGLLTQIQIDCALYSLYMHVQDQSSRYTTTLPCMYIGSVIWSTYTARQQQKKAPRIKYKSSRICKV